MASELRDHVVKVVLDEDRDAICHTTEPVRSGITPQEAAELALESVPDGWAKHDGQWMKVERHSTRPNTGVYLFILRPPGGSSIGAAPGEFGD